jgi:hypothetical protein
MINVTGEELFIVLNSMRENISTSFVGLETSIIGRIDQLNNEMAGQIMDSMMDTMGRMDQINSTLSELISSNWETYQASEQGRFYEIMDSMSGLHGRTTELESQITTSMEETKGLIIQSSDMLNGSINEVGIRLEGLQEYLHLRFLQLEDLMTMVNLSISTTISALCEELNIEMTGNTNDLMEAMDLLSINEMNNITQILELLNALTISLEVLSELEEINDQIVEVDSELQKQGETSESSDSSIKTLEIINLLLLILIAVIASIFLVKMVMANMSKSEKWT